MRFFSDPGTRYIQDTAGRARFSDSPDRMPRRGIALGEAPEPRRAHPFDVFLGV